MEKPEIVTKPKVVTSSKLASKVKKFSKPKIADKSKIVIEKKYSKYDEYKNFVIKQLKHRFDTKRVGIQMMRRNAKKQQIKNICWMRIIINLKELKMSVRVKMGNIIIGYMKEEEVNIMNHQKNILVTLNPTKKI